MVNGIFKGILISTLISGVCQAKPYEAKSITLKPLNVNFYSYAFGFKKLSSIINGKTISIYRDYFGMTGNRPDRNGVGFDLETGYMFTDSIEGFISGGYTKERAISQAGVIDNLPRTTVSNYRFNKRFSYTLSGGGRYYFDMDSSWIPFAGVRIGSIWQKKTTATVFNKSSNNALLGTIRAQKAKNFVDGALQLGVDYRFTKNWYLTLMTGLQYHPRGGTTRSVLKTGNVTRIITYRDNWNKWSIPFAMSLKIVL